MAIFTKTGEGRGRKRVGGREEGREGGRKRERWRRREGEREREREEGWEMRKREAIKQFNLVNYSFSLK